APLGDFALDPPSAIDGIVRDPSGDPVPSAAVSGRTGFGGITEETESGPDGRFRLTRFATGTHVNLFVFAHGYGFATRPAEAPHSGIVVTLKRSGIVRGHVEDAATGSAVTAFTIGWEAPGTGRRFGGGAPRMGDTPFESPDGSYEMTLPPGKWTLVATAAEY